MDKFSPMKKLLLALTLFLIPVAASAQCNGVFSASQVCGSVGGGVPGPIPFSSVGGNAAAPNGSVQFNSGGSFAGNAGLTYSAGNALVITPTALTNNSALNITNSTPNGGSVAGPINLNIFSCLDGTQTITGTTDSLGQIANRTSCFQVNDTVTGGSANHMGVNSWMNVTGSNGGTVAVSGIDYLNGGGTITGPHWGVDAGFFVGPNTTFNGNGVGVLSEVGGASSAGAPTGRVAFHAAAFGAMPAGSNFDAAFMLAVLANQAAPYNGATSFTNGLHFSSNYYGASQFPVVASGNMFLADTGTVASIFNFANVTSTTILSTPNTTLAGSGAAAFGGALVSGTVKTYITTAVQAVAAGALQVGPDATGSHQTLVVDTSIASAVTGLVIQGQASGGGLSLFTQSPATNENLTINSRGSGGITLTHTGASTFNLTVGTAGQTSQIIAPAVLVFQSNSTFAGQVTTGQQWQLGPNMVTPLTGPILTITRNAATPPATGLGTTNQNMLNIVGVDGANSDIVLQAFGTGFNGAVRYLTARGTAASATATQSTDTIGANFAYGYATSVSAGYKAAAGFVMTATDNFTTTTTGARVDIYATPTGTTGIAIGASVGAGFMVGTTTDPGVGSAQLNAQFFMPNITTSSAAQTGTVCWTTGTGKFTVDTTVGCLTSVMKAKDITERLTSVQALNIIDRLSPIAFRYRQGWGDSGQYEQFGLGAEEVAKIDERLVGRDPNGNLQGVRYQELSAVLAGAIKELKADNDNLRDELKKVNRR
jgi:hypothetical protein